MRTRPGHDSKSYDRTTGETVDDGQEKPWRDRAEIGNRDPGRHVTETAALGWRPGCTCYPRAAEWPKLPKRDTGETPEAHAVRCEPAWSARRLLLQLWAPLKTVPCVVLDPFLGSGTTLQVARWHGRHGVGIERNAAYVDMARKRIAAPLHRAPKPKTVKPLDGQLLFPEVAAAEGGEG